MNILLLGSGGREHALAWKIAQSKDTDKLFIAPGNAGTSQLGTNISLNPNDFPEVAEFAVRNNIDLIVVGPEEPLVNGIYDYFQSRSSLKNILVLGPSKNAAQLEGSKAFAKEFMRRHKIPTAAYQSFTANQIDEAEKYIKTLKPPYVLKADGLAAGKGVVIVNDEATALASLREMLINQKFGKASDKVVIEQFLSGIELSVFVITDGSDWLMLPSAKDYKRIGEGDTGLNTGGMGSVSPVPFADEIFMQKVRSSIIRPTIRGLHADGLDYKGFIFFGLINVNGDPFVIEYNVRLGDPETESIIPRISNDLVPLLYNCAKGNVSGLRVDIDDRAAVTLMLVSGGYPEKYAKGYEVSIKEGVFDSSDKGTQLIFHAGTNTNADGKIVTSGGRVIAVTSLAKSQRAALKLSYDAAGAVDFTDKYFRSDIGLDILDEQ